MGQSDSVWKDLSGNGNDCEVHREVFEYPPILEGGRNLLRNSTFNNGVNHWESTFQSGLNSWFIDNKVGFDDSSSICLVGTGVHLWRGFGQWVGTLIEGETYTLSLYVKCDEGIDYGVWVRAFKSTDGGQSKSYFSTSPQMSSIKWEKFTHVFVAEKGDLHGIEIYSSSGNAIGKRVYVDNIKLEKGNKATPWTPAPEDLGLEYPDWIQNFYPGLKDRWYENKLHFINSDSHIQIPEINLNPDNFTIQVDNRIRAFNGDKVITENGDEWGRNLLRNSNFVNGIENWTRNQNVSLSIVDKKLKVIFNQETSTPGVKTLKNLVLPTGTYTISAKVKGSYQGLKFTFYAGSSLPTEFKELTGEWEVVTRTIDLIEPIDYQFMMLTLEPRLESYFLIDWIKIEKGSTATPWVPAPEDITEINIINRNTPFVENNTIHTLRFYNRALTDEEILQNYRATHFLLEPKTFASNDYYNYYDLNRVEINTLAAKDLTEVLRGDISLEDIDFDRDMKSIPFADVLNKVEKNINTLGNKLYKPKGWTQPKLDWTYNQPFSYVDANRLERNLLLLYNYAKGNIDNIPHCGMYICGEEVV